jgi:hypothetical protein
MPVPNVKLVMTITLEIPTNQVVLARNVTATIISMLEDLEIAMQRQESVFSAYMIQPATAVNSVKMVFMVTL